MSAQNSSKKNFFLVEKSICPSSDVSPEFLAFHMFGSKDYVSNLNTPNHAVPVYLLQS